MSSLVEYLKGKTTLTEMNFLSPVTGSVGMVNGRQERLQQAWSDLTVKLEALWLDILDTDDALYELAVPALDDIRATPPEGCKGAIPHFQNLATLLKKAVDTDKYCDDKDLGIYLSRMSQMAEELAYVCDEFDPDAPKVPGTPFKSKEKWDMTQQMDAGKDADLTFVEPGNEDELEHPEGGEEGDPNGKEEFSPEDAEDAEGDELDQFPQPGSELAAGDDDLAFGPDDEEDEDEENGDEDFDASGEEEGVPPPEDAANAPLGDEEDRQDGVTGKGIPSKQTSASPLDTPTPDQDGDEDENPADEEEDGEQNSREPFQIPQKGKENKKKVRNESIESYLAPETESVVLASFAKARDAVLESGRDFDSEFLEAAATLQTVLEEYTDVASAYVELGMVVPGAAPRVDVYVEWDSGSRQSDCYGFGRLVFERAQLKIFDSADRLKETIGLSVTDDELAESLYLALETIWDVSPRRVFESSRVIPALYRLVEKAQRGETVPESALANILQGLRPRLGLQESIRMVSQEISLRLDENFEDLYAYHFEWAVRSPLTSMPIPDELGEPSTMEDPIPDGMQSHQQYGEPYIDSAPVRDTDDDDDRLGATQFHFERKQGALAEHWQTPSLGVSFRDGKIYLVHEGEKAEVDPDTKDEDISARLASMAYQKESIATGHIIEQVDVNRRDSCDVIETMFGNSIHENLSSLVQMSTEELWQAAVMQGIKVPGDGVTWNREKLLSVLSGDDPDVLESTLTEGIHDPNILKAVFMAGGGGSGKGFVSSQMLGGLGLRVVNSDDVLETMAKNPNFRAKFKDLAKLRPGEEYVLDYRVDMMSPDVQQLIRPKAKALAKGKLGLYLQGRLGLIIDSTGRQENKVVKTKKMLEEAGYDTYMVFVDVPLDTALDRNMQRDRRVDPGVLKKAHAEIRANVSNFQSMFGSDFIKIDNRDAPKGTFEEVKASLRKKGTKLIAGPVKNPKGQEWIDAQKKAIELAAKAKKGKQ